MAVPEFFLYFPFLLAISVAFLTGVIHLKQYRAPQDRWLGLFLIVLGVELCTYILQLGAGSFIDPGLRYQLQAISFLALLFILLHFIVTLTGSYQFKITQIFLWSFLFFLSLTGLSLVFSKMELVLGEYTPEIPGSFEAICIGFRGLGLPILFSVAFVVLLACSFLLWKLFILQPSFRPPIATSLVLIIFAGGVIAFETYGFAPLKPVSLFQFLLAMACFAIPAITRPFDIGTVYEAARQSLVNHLNIGFLVLNQKGHIIEINPVAQKVIQGRAQDILGETLENILPKYGVVKSVEAQANPFVQQVVIDRDHGEEVYELKTTLIHGPFQEPIGQLVELHNITDREEIEAKLQRNIEELTRTNQYMRMLADLVMCMQMEENTDKILEILGSSFRKYNLYCFVAQFRDDRHQLTVDYFSGSLDDRRRIENLVGAQINGFKLNEDSFQRLYQIIEKNEFVCYKDGFSQLMGDLAVAPQIFTIDLPNLIGFTSSTTSILLPLTNINQPLGVMGIWGEDLREADISLFQLFASQVSWIIVRAKLHQAETARLAELANSNQLITALSNVSSLLETADSSQVYNTLGAGLCEIGLNCGIVTFTPDTQSTRIVYLSIGEGNQQIIEKIIGSRIKEHQINHDLVFKDYRILEGVPDWYSEPVELIKQFFPAIPANINRSLNQALGFTGIEQLCLLPLQATEEIIVLMPIWGPTLRQADTLTLTLFGRQISGVLKRNKLYDDAIQKTNALKRANSLMLALSKVASQLDSTADIPQVMDALGNELRKVNLSCMVGTLDEDKQNLLVEYLTVTWSIEQIARKIGLYWPTKIIIPRHLWPTDRAVTEKTPYWDPNPIGNTYKMFPFIQKEIFNHTLQQMGFDLSESMCYLPLIVDEDVIGILAVWGPNLQPDDIPAFSVFASQVSTAIKNTLLYGNAQKEIAERVATEARIREALAEKEVLLKEVHHRVKNNLQVISSLLNLQRAEIQEPKTNDALRESQNRVRTMALIHEKLYQSNDLAHVDFSAYIQSLVSSLAQSYRMNSMNIRYQVKSDKIQLDIDAAIPCGLIINELVSNSIKYAFSSQGEGTISVSCVQKPNKQYSLVVEDDGIGLPADFDWANSSSLGIKLVHNLVKQMNGELKISNHLGTRYEIIFRGSES